jgi:effector-binding domain-containing protein
VIDVMTYEVELVQLQPQVSAVVRAHVSVEDIPDFLGDAFEEVLRTLSAQGLAVAGPPFGRYVPVGDGFDVQAGFPSTGVVVPAGRVVAGELPGGPAARVLHTGDYEAVAAAYKAASEWALAHGHAATGPPWECYLDEPDVAAPRTVVYLPCRPE